ncbi:MAG TPA: M48 family metalloprotease [Candidatus Saccharimonadales bacterium]|nr:M48 family metalloprotease [Candidatus Saccharimonadales bacterium]
MYSNIAANKRKTWLIMAVFIAIIGILGWVLGSLLHSVNFIYFALLGAAMYALIEYFMAAKLALAMNGAREIQKSDNPRLFRIVENLAITMGLPTPKIYIINDPAPNAFATGRDPQRAIVCVTAGLLNIMTDTELEGVIAHELGHVQNFDIRVMLIVFGLVSAITIIADTIMRVLWWDDDERNSPIMLVIGLVAAILAPFAALLVQLAVSRRREYLADSTGALTTRYPEGLASALEKIRDHGSAMKRQNTATAHLFFANPLKANAITKFFSTHPPIDDRIRRLREMGTHA